MAQVLYATNRFAGDGATTTFSVSFQGGYISKDHVKAFITDANGVRTDITLTPGMWVGAYTLNIGQSVPIGSTLTIRRETPRGSSLVDYTNGTRITERNLDLANTQAVFVGAEAHDLFDVEGVAEAISGVTAEAAAHAAAAAASASSAAGYAGQVQASVDTAAGYAAAASASVTLAQAQVGLAATQVGLAATHAEQADLHADSASTSANSASLSASSAATTYTNTQALAAAIEVAGVGFSAGAYDFGSVADPATYFDRDYGTLP